MVFGTGAAYRIILCNGVLYNIINNAITHKVNRFCVMKEIGVYVSVDKIAIKVY